MPLCTLRVLGLGRLICPLSRAFFFAFYIQKHMPLPTITASSFDSDTQWTNQAGESDSLNLWEMAAIVSGGTIAANGIALLGAVAPAFTTVFGSTAVATAYVGYCKRHNLDLNPTTWEMFQKKQAAVATPQPAAVVDTKGNEVEVENL